MKRLDFEEAKARLEQVKREREALEAAYADLMADLAQSPAAASTTAEKPKLPAEVVQLVARLTALLETERQQSSLMWELLADAYVRLNEAYED